MAVDSTRNRIYVANRDDNTVTVLNGQTSLVVGSVRVGTAPSAIAVDEANNRIYVANAGSGTISVLDGASLGF